MSLLWSVRRRSAQVGLAVAALLLALVGSLIVEKVPGWPGVADSSPAAPPAVASLAEHIELLQDWLRTNPDDQRAYRRLGEAYLLRTRETGDPSYYPKAEAILQEAHRRDRNDIQTMNALGTLALARHQFDQALDWAQRAQALNSVNAVSYGVAGDALIELGRYEEAFASYQAMVDRRPDLSSYARVSYARELLGNRAGAIEAMQRAVTAAGTITESANWVAVQLGQLYFGQGDLAAADFEYRRVLARSPDYAPALAGLAAVRVGQGQSEEAIALYQRALTLMPLPEYAIALGELQESLGQTAEAQRQYELVRVFQQLNQANGVDADLELALFEADHGDPEQAVVQASRARAARPSIQGDDALAWSLYRVGACADAQPLSQAARRLGTQDALLLYHAGLIAECAGQPEEARALLQAAFNLNPAFSPWHAAQARQALARLSS